MNFVDNHPWVTRFVSIELALVVIAVLLYVVTPPTPTSNPLDWYALKIVGLLIGGFAIIIGAFGFTVGLGFLSSRYL